MGERVFGSNEQVGYQVVGWLCREKSERGYCLCTSLKARYALAVRQRLNRMCNGVKARSEWTESRGRFSTNHQPRKSTSFLLEGGLNLKEGELMFKACKDGWRDGKGG